MTGRSPIERWIVTAGAGLDVEDLDRLRAAVSRLRPARTRRTRYRLATPLTRTRVRMTTDDDDARAGPLPGPRRKRGTAGPHRWSR